VPEDVKQSRLDRLMTLQQSISLERNRLRVGQTVSALAEEVRDGGTVVARSAAEAPDADGVLLLSGGKGVRPGDFVSARITGAQPYDLTGVIL
jgi:ribosomal protein S12 methylthiotransferase